MRAKSCFPPPPSSSSSPPLFPPPFHLISPIELMDWPLRRRISFHALPLPPISRGGAKNRSEKGGFSYLPKEGRRKGCTPKFKEEKMSETELIILVHTTSHTLSTPGKHNKDCTAAHIKISLFRPSSQAVAPTPQKQLPKVGGRRRWTKCVRRGRGELMKLFIPSFSLFLLLPPSPQDRGEQVLCQERRKSDLSSLLGNFPPAFCRRAGGRERVPLFLNGVCRADAAVKCIISRRAKEGGIQTHLSSEYIRALFWERLWCFSENFFVLPPSWREGWRERERVLPGSSFSSSERGISSSSSRSSNLRIRAFVRSPPPPLSPFLDDFAFDPLLLLLFLIPFRRVLKPPPSSSAPPLPPPPLSDSLHRSLLRA